MDLTQGSAARNPWALGHHPVGIERICGEPMRTPFAGAANLECSSQRGADRCVPSRETGHEGLEGSVHLRCVPIFDCATKELPRKTARKWSPRKTPTSRKAKIPFRVFRGSKKFCSALQSRTAGSVAQGDLLKETRGLQSKPSGHQDGIPRLHFAALHCARDDGGVGVAIILGRALGGGPGRRAGCGTDRGRRRGLFRGGGFAARG